MILLHTNLPYDVCVRNILEDSYKYKLGHIPSALSLLMITHELFKNEHLSSYVFSIGKTFGAQAWFQDDEIRKNFLHDYPSKKILSLTDLTNSSILGIFCQSELGIASSYSVGYAISNNEQKVITILSDADTFIQSTRHAMQIAKRRNLNVTFIIDANNIQLFGKNDCRNILTYYDEVKPCELNEFLSAYDDTRCAVVPTIKGYRCSVMEEHPQAWHYKLLDEETYETISR